MKNNQIQYMKSMLWNILHTPKEDFHNIYFNFTKAREN